MFLKKAAVLKLFKYDKAARACILVDYQMKSKTLEYVLQRYLVVLF